MFGLFKRKKNNAHVYAAYNVIVAQARQPVFYTDYSVPDTAEGRFENIALHIFLFLHRLKAEEAVQNSFGQEVFDLFFLDMDRSLREAGVGDVTIPKRIKTMAEAFFGRIKSYDEALSSPESSHQLAQTLARLIYAQPPSSAVLEAFASYVLDSVELLKKTPTDALLEGKLVFPSPKVLTHE